MDFLQTDNRISKTSFQWSGEKMHEVNNYVNCNEYNWSNASCHQNVSYKCENEAEKVIPADLDKDSNFKIEVKCVDGALKVSAQSLNGWLLSYLTPIHYSSYFNNLDSVFCNHF